MPFPQSFETVTWPPISRMNAQTCGSPKPVPLSPLVVKNGSNALRTTSAGMPSASNREMLVARHSFESRIEW